MRTACESMHRNYILFLLFGPGALTSPLSSIRRKTSAARGCRPCCPFLVFLPWRSITRLLQANPSTARKRGQQTASPRPPHGRSPRLLRCRSPWPGHGPQPGQQRTPHGWAAYRREAEPFGHLGWLGRPDWASGKLSSPVASALPYARRASLRHLGQGRPVDVASLPAVVPTHRVAGHGNSIHCHSGNRNCPDVSDNPRSSRSRSTLDGLSPVWRKPPSPADAARPARRW